MSHVSISAHRGSQNFSHRRAITLRMKTAWHGSIGLWLILHLHAPLNRELEILVVTAVYQRPVTLSPLDRTLGKAEDDRAIPITIAFSVGVGVF